MECLRIEFLIINQTNRGKNSFLHVRRSPKQTFNQKLCTYYLNRLLLYRYIIFGKPSFLLGPPNPAHCLKAFLGTQSVYL